MQPSDDPFRAATRAVLTLLVLFLLGFVRYCK